MGRLGEGAVTCVRAGHLVGLISAAQALAPSRASAASPSADIHLADRRASQEVTVDVGNTARFACAR